MFEEVKIPGERICPQCGTAKLKTWDELSEDEKFFTRYFAASSEFTKQERAKHLFCMKCRFETISERGLRV